MQVKHMYINIFALMEYKQYKNIIKKLLIRHAFDKTINYLLKCLLFS